MRAVLTNSLADWTRLSGASAQGLQTQSTGTSPPGTNRIVYSYTTPSELAGRYTSLSNFWQSIALARWVTSIEPELVPVPERIVRKAVTLRSVGRLPVPEPTEI